MNSCTVLCSGGIDSLLVLDIILNDPQFDAVYGLFIDYGQKTVNRERRCVLYFWQEFFARRYPRKWRGTSSTKETTLSNFVTNQQTQYIPLRNLRLLTAAFQFNIQYAISNNVAIGCQKNDYDVYSDCQVAFLANAEATFRVALNDTTVRIFTPILAMTKVEIIQAAVKRNLPLQYTWSCYQDLPQGPCGICGACIERKDAFEAANLKDPLYENGK